MKCINCKHANIIVDRATHKMDRIYCKLLHSTVPMKTYKKLKFCLFHERKEDR